MDMLYFLAMHADDALIHSQKFLDDKKLFGPMKGVTLLDQEEVLVSLIKKVRLQIRFYQLCIWSVTVAIPK